MQHTFNRVMICTDFSESATNALETAIAICKRHQSVLYIVHVIQNHLFEKTDASFEATEQTFGELKTKSLDYLNDIKKSIQAQHELKVELISDVGYIATMVRTFANILSIDLVIIGSHGNSGWNEYFAGSNALAIIRQCEKPVLSVPITYTRRVFENILYPVRPSKGTILKYDFIKPIIQINNSSIHLLGLTEHNDPVQWSSMENEFNKIQNLFKDEGYNFTKEKCSVNNISEKVLETATKQNADLIVLSNTLDSKWNYFSSGYYMKHIFNKTQCPAVIVKPVMDKIELSEQYMYLVAEANHAETLGLTLK